MTNDQVSALVAALNDHAQSIYSLASAVKSLGLNDAATSMGAIETLSKELRDGLHSIAVAIDRVAP